MNRVDRWWNRRFPPHSLERLIFLCVAAVPIGLLVGVGRDLLGMSEFSWDVFWGLTLCSWVVIALGWYLAGEGYGPQAVDEEDDAPFWTTHGTNASEMPPPAGGVPLPPSAASDISPTRTGEPERMALQRKTTASEIVISGLLIFLGLRVSTAAVFPEDAWSLIRFAGDLGAAALVLMVVATSFSLFALLAMAVVLAYPGAVLLHMFFFFLGGDEGMWGYYFFSLCFTVPGAIGFWAQTRALRRLRGGQRIPLWATSLGACLLMSIVSLTYGTYEPETEMVSSRSFVDPGLSAAVDDEPLGAATPEEASRAFVTAWVARDAILLGRVAYPSVVTSTLAMPVPDGLAFDACGLVTGFQRCALTGGPQVFLLGFDRTDQGAFFVRFVERRPSGFEMDV